ncbi:MAG: DUF3078 domain-containing protein [Cyclobacteriaceae bacterium]
MKLKLSVFALLSVFLTHSYAQNSDTTYWKVGGASTLTFSQVSLNNWAAGGENNVSLNGYFLTFANYLKGKVDWSNSLEMGYGVIKQGVADLRKTDDVINATTQLGVKLPAPKLFFTSLLDFKTQFVQGLNADEQIISNFMAPGYLLVATGLNWKPSEVFSATYTPVTGKMTFVRDQALADAGAFGVKPGENFRAELGSYLKMNFVKADLIKNVGLTSKLELFSNYIKDFGNIDVNWQNALVMKVNSLITVNWQTQLIYDDDIKIQITDEAGNVTGASPMTQFKSVFGVGISYNFGAKPE